MVVHILGIKKGVLSDLGIRPNRLYIYHHIHSNHFDISSNLERQVGFTLAVRLFRKNDAHEYL